MRFDNLGKEEANDMCVYRLHVVSYLGSWMSYVIKMPLCDLIDILNEAHICDAHNDDQQFLILENSG